MICVDLDLGDLGYFEARVLFKNCTEPQAAGVCDVRVFINFNDREVEIFDKLRESAQAYIYDEINQHLAEVA
jgi:hypothetical protein